MAWKPRTKGNPSLRTAEDWRALAIKNHLCTSCQSYQAEIWKICPKCKATDANREYMPSMAELKRANQLILLQGAGHISQLKFHPRIDLVVEGTKICTYEADSAYVENGKQIYEDVKPSGGFIEPVAKLKIRLFDALMAKHGIKIKIFRNS